MKLPAILNALIVLAIAAPVSSAQREWDLRPCQRMSRSDFRAKALQEIEKLRHSVGGYWSNPGGFSSLHVETAGEYPGNTLCRMGIEVIPILVEYLTDESPTQLLRNNPRRIFPPASGPIRPENAWKFNEVIAQLISSVAKYTYPQYNPYSPKGIDPYGLEASKGVNFKTSALNWYAENRNIPPEDRQIEGLRDPKLRNYSSVLSWLAANQTQKAVQPITRFIDALIDGQLKSGQLEGDISLAAWTLAEIGDKNGLSGAIRASHWAADLFRDDYYNSADRISRIFGTFQARIKLGDRTKSLRELEQLYDDCTPKMKEVYRELFEKQMLKLRRGMPLR